MILSLMTMIFYQHLAKRDGPKNDMKTNLRKLGSVMSKIGEEDT